MNPVASNYKWVLLAIAIYREARGCTHDQRAAIAHVVANRAADPGKRYGVGLVAVLTAPEQFTSISPPHYTWTTLNEWINATTWPQESDTIWQDCCAIADAIGEGTDGADPTYGATNYYSDPIAQIPSWANPAYATVVLGPFHFFKLP